MSKLIHFLLITGCLFCNSLYSSAHCCPSIDTAYIFTNNQSSDDSVYLVTDVTASYQGSYIGYTISDFGSVIIVEACYYANWLPAEQNYKDTINLGLKNFGAYDLFFIAYQSENPSVCDYADTNTFHLQFDVSSTGLKLNEKGNFAVYPNPARGVININGDSSITKVEFWDLSGRLINSYDYFPTLNIEHKGTYILKFFNNESFVECTRIVLQ